MCLQRHPGAFCRIIRVDAILFALSSLVTLCHQPSIHFDDDALPCFCPRSFSSPHFPHQALTLSPSLQCKYFDVSALENVNITQTFREVCTSAAGRIPPTPDSFSPARYGFLRCVGCLSLLAVIQ